ncbi:hypothetical protein, partial [Lacimicrobium alkaliphilum]|uniref:hypothetical protein n=1 Tax=Lacimicrobium alkaliphilum TaxID=1526571 RepID=UPI001C557603
TRILRYPLVKSSSLNNLFCFVYRSGLSLPMSPEESAHSTDPNFIVNDFLLFLCGLFGFEQETGTKRLFLLLFQHFQRYLLWR